MKSNLFCFYLLPTLLVFECVSTAPKRLESCKDAAFTDIAQVFDLKRFNDGYICATCFCTLQKFKSSGKTAASMSIALKNWPTFQFAHSSSCLIQEEKTGNERQCILSAR